MPRGIANTRFIAKISPSQGKWPVWFLKVMKLTIQTKINVDEWKIGLRQRKWVCCLLKKIAKKDTVIFTIFLWQIYMELDMI